MTNYVSTYTGAEIDARLSFASHHIIAKTGVGDYVCSNYANDAACIQAALNAATSGDEIIFLEGNYTVNTPITQTDKSLSLYGRGQVTFTCTLPTEGDAAFYFNGGDVLTTTLSADAVLGAESVVLTSVTNVAVGQLIILYTDVIWSSTYNTVPTGHIYKVRAISGNTVYLNTPLLQAQPAATSGVIVKKAITINAENLSFLSDDETGLHTGLKLSNTKNNRIINCIFKKWGASAIALYQSYDVIISNNVIEECNATNNGFGINLVDTTSKVLIANNIINRCKSCVVTTTQSTAKGQIRDIVIDKNIMQGEIGINTHSCVLNFEGMNNLIRASSIACTVSAQYTTLSNNQIFLSAVNAGAFKVQDIITQNRIIKINDNLIKNGYLFYNNIASPIESIIIMNNKVECGTGADVALYSQSNGAHYSITIKNNDIKSSASQAIYLLMTSIANACIFDITGNILRDTATEAIRIDSNTSYDHITKIGNNIILNPNTGNDGDAGIYLLAVHNALINDNQIYDVAAHAGSAIWTNTGCDYNVVINNIAKDMTGTKYVLTGSNNITSNNVSL